MNDRIEKIKKHIEEHKEAYVVGGVCLLIGAAGSGLIISNRSFSEISLVQKVKQIGIGNRANAIMINMLERSTPSKPVHLVGTSLYFDSLSEAARQTGHSLAQISRNVNGHIPDVGGDVFELLTKAV